MDKNPLIELQSNNVFSNKKNAETAVRDKPINHVDKRPENQDKLCTSAMGNNGCRTRGFQNIRQEIKKNVTLLRSLQKNCVYLHFKDKKDWEC